MALFDRQTRRFRRAKHMMSKTQSAEILLDWHATRHGSQDLSVVEYMVSLKHLEIVWDYSEKYEWLDHVMYLPNHLSSTLTYFKSCSLLLCIY